MNKGAMTLLILTASTIYLNKLLKCGGSLSISTGTRLGLMVTIEIRCTKCFCVVSTKSSLSLQNSKQSEVNVRAVYSFRCIG